MRLLTLLLILLLTTPCYAISPAFQALMSTGIDKGPITYGWETSADGWALTGFSRTGAVSHAGDWSLQGSETFSATKKVVASTNGNITLWVFSNESAGARTLYLDIDGASTDIGTYAAGSWVQKSVAVTAGTHTIRVRGQTIGSGYLIFVDDVSIP